MSKLSRCRRIAQAVSTRQLEAILSEQPEVLLHADSDASLGLEDMARNLAQFRATLIEELAEQPIAFSLDDDEGDGDDEPR